MILPPAEQTFVPDGQCASLRDTEKLARWIVQVSAQVVMVDLSSTSTLVRAVAALAPRARIWTRAADVPARKRCSAGFLSRLPTDRVRGLATLAPGCVDVLVLGDCMDGADVQATVARWAPKLAPGARVLATGSEAFLRALVAQDWGRTVPGCAKHVIMSPSGLPSAPERIHDAAEAIWSDLSPRIEALVTERMAALERRLERRLTAAIGRRLPALYGTLEPLVQGTVKHKNDVQDDAIIGIGAKVDAQDAAIQDIVRHLHRLLRHPLFR